MEHRVLELDILVQNLAPPPITCMDLDLLFNFSKPLFSLLGKLLS